MGPRKISCIDDAQRYISELYPNKDRDFSYIFGYAARHLGYLGKALNQKRADDQEFIRTISWLLALANHLEIDVETALIERHPEICPYCVTRPCDCQTTAKRPANGLPAYKIPEELSHKSEMIKRSGPSTFQAHAERIGRIYPGNSFVWSAIGAWQHTSKMQEELAEVHEAATRMFKGRKSKSAVAEEFADLFAWILSSWMIVHGSNSFDEAFILFYAAGCPVCAQQTKCQCDLFSDKSSQLVDVEKIEKIESLFRQLAKELGKEGDEIDSITRSLKMAATSQSEPVARTAVVEARNKAQEFEKAIETGAKNTKNATTILQALYKLYESLPFI